MQPPSLPSPGLHWATAGAWERAGQWLARGRSRRLGCSLSALVAYSSEGNIPAPLARAWMHWNPAEPALLSILHLGLSTSELLRFFNLSYS